MRAVRKAVAVFITAAVVSMSEVSPAFGAAEVACAIAGDVTLERPAGAPPGNVHVLFDGVTTTCEGTGADDAATVLLDGSYSCADFGGPGMLELRWPDGSSSLAPTVITSSALGIATLGTIKSGPYEGDGVSMMVAAVGLLEQCQTTEAASVPATGVIHVHPKLLGTTVGPDVGTVTTDPWSVKDESDGTVDRSIARCAIPGDMYHSENSMCKYSQGWVGTRCTRTRQVSTGGTTSERVCTQKQMTKFAYRGGTSNLRSPKISGRCANSSGVSTDTEQWQLYRFRLVKESNKQVTYLAPGPGSLRSNCDTEGQFFYGTPNPVTMDSDHRAEYLWVHFPCGYFRSCQIQGDSGFESSLTFGIGVPA